ncbi:MAG: hypothetical protein LC642_08235 [Verrucomicrobiaceae bacterium]|nr:hypothetical protein [Verrucomicrobiaceae bacterium]
MSVSLVALLFFAVAQPPVPAPSESIPEAGVDRDGAGPAGEPSTALVRGPVLESRLVIEDDIAPAVMPYLGCLMARDGVQVRGRYDPRPQGVGPGADCTPFRERAEREADVLLRRIGGRSREERAALIEQTLSSIDDFQQPRPVSKPIASTADAENR